MSYTKPRHIVCAAIRAENGDVLLGIRHYSLDMVSNIRSLPDGNKFSHRHSDDQGFVDQFGKYLTRSEAYVVALNAGQILYPNACCEEDGKMCLFSEGLY